MMRPEPLVLVLDEPTAALDAATEHALFERYTAAARASAARTGAVTVLVSHRFSTVRTADCILVVGEGGWPRPGPTRSSCPAPVSTLSSTASRRVAMRERDGQESCQRRTRCGYSSPRLHMDSTS